MIIPDGRETVSGPDQCLRSLSRTVRRQRVLLAVAAGAAVLAVVGLVASWSVKSPAQVASEQAPPPPGVLTAEVRSVPLEQTVTVRATVEAPATFKVRSLTAGSLGPRVVTGTPLPMGAEVESGRVVLEVSGRPLFVMAGDVPAYRDLGRGIEGQDVRQLQRSLAATGDLSSDSVTGVVDWRTQNAVARLYARAGYPTSGTGNSIAVPLSELSFVPTLPATVASLPAVTGAPLGTDTGPLVELNTGALKVRALVPSGEQGGIKAGQRVRVTDDITGRQVDGVVQEVGAFTSGADQTAGLDQGGAAAGQANMGGNAGAASVPGQGAGARAGYPVLVTPEKPLDLAWLGLSMRAQIFGAATDGPVLTVPSSAVVSEASGDTSVVVLASDGTRTTVRVRTGMISGGLVQVTPREGATLQTGDRVVTG